MNKEQRKKDNKDCFEKVKSILKSDLGKIVLATSWSGQSKTENAVVLVDNVSKAQIISVFGGTILELIKRGALDKTDVKTLVKGLKAHIS